MSIARARAAINTAQSHLHRVQSAWFDPADAEVAVMFAFYAYENAIVAVAEVRSVPWKKNHYDKAELASKFATTGIVTRDIGDLLRSLNEARKDVSYGEPGRDLASIDLEVLASELEEFVDEVERLVSDAEEG